MKCSFCENEAIYNVGFSKFNWKTKSIIKGCSCINCIPEAINRLSTGSFGTLYWPVVLLGNKIVYHSYQASLNGMSHLGGWFEFLINNKNESKKDEH